MLPVSAMSDAATRLRSLLMSNIGDLAELKQVKIGHPKDTIATMEADLNSVNLFFYHVGYDGYPADVSSENPFYVRLYCLVTAVGAKPADSGPSSGENDLRLIGEVMRVLHEQPLIMVEDKDGETIAELQVVPHALDLDNLNHIWSTQGDVAYRLSVAYEMSLAPVPLAQPIERAPRVGELGVEAWPNTSRVDLPAGGLGIDAAAPEVPFTEVHSNVPDWQPHICFADIPDESLAYHLVVAKSALPASDPLTLKVAMAGKTGEGVQLFWETWNSTDGWVRSDSSQAETLGGDTIDPDSFFDPLVAGMVADVEVPIDDAGQAMLYAERTRTLADGSSRKIRSNPVLVTVTGGTS